MYIFCVYALISINPCYYISLSSQAVGSTAVVIGWAVWKLFDETDNQWQSSGLANVVLTLKAGPGFKPPVVPASAWNSCYRVCVCARARVCVTHLFFPSD